MASCKKGVKTPKLITDVDQKMETDLGKSLELSGEPDCILTEHKFNEEISQVSWNSGLVPGCDDCFAGLEYIRHVNKKPKDFWQMKIFKNMWWMWWSYILSGI